jgi:hypothetical protein
MSVIFMPIEPNAHVSENIIDNSKRLLHFLDVERNKSRFRRFYLGNPGEWRRNANSMRSKI